MKQTGNGPDALCVVICDFNGWEETRRCLTALFDSSSTRAHVILVDHGTSSETAEGLARHFPRVEHLRASPNHWWSGATNCGIRRALAEGFEQIMLLNNDCYAHPDMIRRLLDHSHREPHSVIAPVQAEYDTGKILATTSSTCLLLGFTSLGSPHRQAGARIETKLAPTRNIVGGRGVVIWSNIFDQVGLLDEARLPHYGADHDFYLRCRKRGVALKIAMDCKVYVDRQRTSISETLYGNGWAGYRRALSDRKSHRNLQHQIELYRKHYPIKGLHWLGISLFLIRFTAVYWARSFWLWARTAF